jgi:hypothetical protein
MNSDLNYHPNTSRITYEIIEGEVIIVDLESGVYFSINPLGSVIFNWLVEGAKLDDIVSTVEQHFKDTNTDIAQAVNSFIGALLRDEIIVCGEKTRDDDTVAGIKPLLDGLSDYGSFEPLLLEKYTDMQDLLLLDPIHEVNEDGWPFTQKDDTKPAA